ncbi:MAG: S8 family serine peptidase [Blastocatellia bacterium]|nr:S8 family serine peptidase [Blastocatellia bacterium]
MLTPRNVEELAQLLREQADPTSPQFHQWLTAEEFGRRFGRTPDEYQEIQQWLTDAGLEVVQTWPNALQITVTGERSLVEQAFQVTLQQYQIGTETGYAPDQDPSVPERLAPWVTGIVGLHSFSPFHPTLSLSQPGTQQEPNFNSLRPDEVVRRYNAQGLLAAGSNGTNRTIAIVARSDFDLADQKAFQTRFGLPLKSAVKIFPFGLQPVRNGVEEAEVALDCQWAGAIARDAEIQVVIAPDINLSLQAIVNHPNKAAIISISYAGCERGFSEAETNLLKSLFEQAATQGQSVFVAAGNDGISGCFPVDGSKTPSVNLLAASPFVTGVGGTDLEIQRNQEGMVTGFGNETTWGRSGGGTSTVFSRPEFQTGLGGNTPFRQVPDVALLAGSPGYTFVFHGDLSAASGTSFAAPCWAGFCALLLEAQNVSRLGCLNPELYRLGRNQAANGPKVFFDITSGTNGNPEVSGETAGPGYDAVTGWGALDAHLLVQQFIPPQTVDTGPPTVSLLAPQGGELVSGQEYLISWESKDDGKITRHDITLSLNEGTSFPVSIATGLSGSATGFLWKVPLELPFSNKARVAVTATDSGFHSTMAVSRSNISIVAQDTTPPQAAFLTPANGDKFISKSLVTIRWRATDNVQVDNQEIRFSLDGGKTTYQTVLILNNRLPAPDSLFSFDYFFPAKITTTRARFTLVVRDRSLNETTLLGPEFSITNESEDNVFPVAQIQSPAGGEKFPLGGTITINWKSSDETKLYQHYVYAKGRDFFDFVGRISGDAQSVVWKIPKLNTPISQVVLQLVVLDTSNNLKMVTSQPFSLVLDSTAPKVQVTTPNGGERAKAGKPLSIQWSASDDLGLAQHDIWLSTDGGLSFRIPLALGLTGSATSATVPLPTSVGKTKTARIRVIVTDQAGNQAADESDSNFQVKPAKP